MSLHTSSISNPLDILHLHQQNLHKSEVNALVKTCDSLPKSEELKVDSVIQSLLERGLFSSASQLAVKIISPVGKTDQIQKIHRAIVKVLRNKPECYIASRILQAIHPRSPDWRSYGSVLYTLLNHKQFWAAKALIPLISDPRLQERQQEFLTEALAKNGHITEALSRGYLLVPKSSSVGELQELWQFPSDHLPIGMSYENDHFLSWNVLDNQYINWITTKNTMGLSHSLIAQENVFEKNSSLTVRDRHVVDLVCHTLNHPTHPRSILALQECGFSFIQLLREKLPEHFHIHSYNGNTIIIDTRKYEIIDAAGPKVQFEVFKDSPHVTFQNLHLKRLKDDKILRIVNVHVPGNPEKPSRFEFAQYLRTTFDPTCTTIVMGDMNFNEMEMSEALDRAFEGESPFSLCAPYPTNISPYTLVSKAIDQFFFYSPDDSMVDLNAPNEVIVGLQRTADLLQ